MDNCGGHELDCTLPGVRIELLPPPCTSKYQPLDLGLIFHSNIRYRSVLLRITIEVMMRSNEDTLLVNLSSKRGVRGIEKRCLPHVGDAIKIFEEAWSQTSRATVIKCWMKSTCLLHQHMMTVTCQLRDLCAGSSGADWITVSDAKQIEDINADQITIEDPITVSESEHLSASVTSVSLLDIPKTPLSEVLGEVSAISGAADFLNILKSPAPFDMRQTRADISRENLSEVWTMHQVNNGEAIYHCENLSENKNTDPSGLVQTASQSLNNVDDPELKNDLEIVLSRATSLSTSFVDPLGQILE